MGLQACRVWSHAGTFHYVYTIRKKLAVAGDLLSAVGWRRRVASVEFDEGSCGVPPEILPLPRLFARGVSQIEVARLERDGHLAGTAPLPPSRKAALVAALEWAEALKAEGVSELKEDGCVAALRTIWRVVRGGEAAEAACPWGD